MAPVVDKNTLNQSKLPVQYFLLTVREEDKRGVILY